MVFQDSSSRKRSYKRYLRDTSAPIPQSTRYRWATQADLQQQQHATPNSSPRHSVEPNYTHMEPTTSDRADEDSQQEGRTTPSHDGDEHLSNSTEREPTTYDIDDSVTDLNLSDNYEEEGRTTPSHDGDENLSNSAERDPTTYEIDDSVTDLNLSDNYEEEEILIMRSTSTGINSNETVSESTIHNKSRKDQPLDDAPIYEGADVSRSQVLALTLAFIIRHQISGLGLQDLLKLLNLIAPGCVPESKFHFDKYFNAYDCNIQFHFYCQHCASLLVFENEKYSCEECEETFLKPDLVKAGNYFLTLPISVQLMDLFNNHKLGEYLQASNPENRHLSDIRDGRFFTKNPKLRQFLSNKSNVSFSFSTDGVPVFKSSKFSIWPLFCTINEVPYDKRSEFVMLHSLWFGPEKPRMDVYLKPFLREMAVLEKNGIEWVDANGVPQTTRCTAIMCVCDTVARPMVQNFKQFNGYFGCCSCLHPGHRLQTKIVYPLMEDIISRSHVETLQHAEQAVENGTAHKGVKGPSHLVLLKHFDVVESFPPDYMHCVLLGVVRQLTDLMFNSIYHDEAFYLGGSMKAIDSELINLKPPNEIKRSPRSLTVRKFWKASEWRTYLLFYSPIILKGKATREMYGHWLLLVNAMHLLLGQNISANDITEAKLCLLNFVSGVRSLYGLEHCSCNVHLLTHLGDVVENWGPLWASSAFVYEDASGRLLKMFHGTQSVPLQIFKRFFATRKLREIASI